MAHLNLAQLLPLIEKMPACRQLVDKLRKSDGGTRVAVLDAAKPYLIAALYQKLQLPVLVVTAQPENSKKLHEQLSTWCGSGQVQLFPEPDALPYQRIASDTSTEQERLQALFALANIDKGQNAPLIVTSAPALMQKITPRNDFISACHTVKPGMNVEPFHLLSRWEAMGYTIESIVEVPGTISHRGGIIDIYPPTSDLPARLEFLGNTVDSIRLFDPASQRSLKTVTSIAIAPATEMLNQNTDSLLNYLPPDALLVLDEATSIQQAAEDLEAEAEQLRAGKIEAGELPPDFPRPYFTWQELEPVIKDRRRLLLTSWDSYDGEPPYRLNFVVI